MWSCVIEHRSWIDETITSARSSWRVGGGVSTDYPHTTVSRHTPLGADVHLPRGELTIPHRLSFAGPGKAARRT
jgi:hypothetical protein